MAKSIPELKMTPLMALSVMALFVMMIPLFTMMNSGGEVKTTTAASEPTPTPRAIGK